MSTISIYLSKLALAIPDRKVGDTAYEEDYMVVGAVENITTAERRTRGAITPFSIGRAAIVSLGMM